MTHPALCSLFSQCHPWVPPQHYYEACIFDSCFVPNSGMECASVQAYAALCSQEKVCVDWRSHTNGSCGECPPSPPLSSPLGGVPTQPEVRAWCLWVGKERLGGWCWEFRGIALRAQLETA